MMTKGHHDIVLKYQNLGDDIIVRAKALVREYFKLDLDKGGSPYYYHLFQVAKSASELSENFDGDYETFCNRVYATGLLHDLLEDKGEIWTPLMLHELFDREIAEAVCALTRNFCGEESYSEFIKRCAKNEIAYYVKIADLEHNMDVKRLEELTKDDLSRLAKYHKNWRWLIENPPERH